ncbi:MAG: sodium-dependent transporter [Pseudomonadota bacterium]
MLPKEVPAKKRVWSSRLTFLFATIGFAVGLGNIWRLPYTAGENGGGAFLVVYVIWVAIIGVPLIMAELSLGRSGGGDPPLAWRALAAKSGMEGRWSWAGWLAILTNLAIMTFYCVIGGWTFAYFWMALQDFAGLGGSGDNALAFSELLNRPLSLIGWQGLFIAANVFILIRGFRGGIERMAAVAMPVLFVLLVVMLVLAWVYGDSASAAAFLFDWKLADVTTQTVTAALGQAFFSVGVGLAVLTTFGAYLRKDEPIGRLSAAIAGGDTLVALVAGMAVFPFVFMIGVAPSAGPELIFVTMQEALSRVGVPAWAAVMFFGLIALAALTSSVATFEIMAGFGERRGLGRRTSLVLFALAVFALGWLTVFSFNIASEFHPMRLVSPDSDATMFDLIDAVTAGFLLPLCGWLIAVFFGWRLRADVLADAVGWSVKSRSFFIWRATLRYLVTPVLTFVLIQAII